MYTTRVSFSVVIDTMVREFEWGNHQRGFALAAFFYGYIATQILGGVIAGIVGGHWVSATFKSYQSIINTTLQINDLTASFLSYRLLFIFRYLDWEFWALDCLHSQRQQ
jgi:hypothetical protein